MTPLQLPALDALADRVADDLVEGRVVVLRGQPWSGRSTVVESVRERLNGVIPVTRASGFDDGHALTTAIETFEGRTSGAVAALLVDDFGDALATTHGVIFQNRLHAWAVDGPHAPDAAVLLVARQNESLTRFPAAGGGSPVAGAANTNLNVPTLRRDEVVTALVSDGCDTQSAEQLVDRCGGHLELIAVARTSRELAIPEVVQDDAVMRAVSETTGATAERMLELARRPERSLAEVLTDGLLAPAVYSPAAGQSRLCPVLAARGIGALVVGGRAGWPDNMNASVRRFRCRLEALPYAIWVDRYHGRFLDRVTDFFGRLAARNCAIVLRMLGSSAGIEGLPNGAKRRFEESLGQWAQAGLRVEWRIAANQDHDLLHQRMLASPFRLSGYLLPPCDRIVGGLRGGNDTDAILDPAPLPLLAHAWDRSEPFMRW